MNPWTEDQVLVIARRVLADPSASDERKAWARDALRVQEQERAPAEGCAPLGNVEAEKVA